MSLYYDAKLFAATVGGRPVTALVWLTTLAFGALALLDPSPFPRMVYFQATAVFTAWTWLRTAGPQVRLV